MGAGRNMNSLRLRIHWPGLPPSFSAIANRILAGISYLMVAVTEQTTRSNMFGGKSIIKSYFITSDRISC